jgi:hypothetical protein
MKIDVHGDKSMMNTEHIITEIDATLDQLIRNAEAVSAANFPDLTEGEIDAFEKTQESLLHHFLYMDQLLKTKSVRSPNQDKRSVAYRIQEKALRFKKLKSAVNDTIRKSAKKFPIFSKRRSKKFLSTERD